MSEKISNEIDYQLFHNIESMINESIDYITVLDYLKKYTKSDYTVGITTYLLISEGLYSKAKKILDDNVLISGTYTDMSKGLIYLYKKNRIKAKEYLLKSYKNDKSKTNRYIRLELSRFYFHTNKEKSLIFLEEAISVDKNYINALLFKAITYLMENKIYKGIRILKRLKKKTNNIFVYYHLSMAYFNKGNTAKAKKYLENALKIKVFPEAYCGIGYIFEINNKKEQALDFYMKAYNLNPNNIEVNTKLAWFYSNTDISKAKKYFENVYKFSDYPNDILNLIYAELSVGDFDNFKTHYKQYVSIYGLDYRIEYFKILHLVLIKDIKEAQMNYNKYLDKFSVENINWLKAGLESWNVEINYTSVL